MITQETAHRLFGEDTSRNWAQDPDINNLFLRTSENYLNDALQARGHLFLNEAYDQLGLARTSQGAISGWLRATGNPVKFWSNELETNEDGYIILVFITDGIIYDKIEAE